MILAIESSCDESALALFDPMHGMRGEWIHSQIALHRRYGGVVPDLASREHLDNFPVLLAEAEASKDFARVTTIAVTRGPGLAGCLAIGLALGKALAFERGVPLIGVNHLRGHAWSPFIRLHAEAPANFWEKLVPLLPHLGLLVSGGNTILYRLEAGGGIEIINRTVDDAAGEALDKGAKLLGLPYPGGPCVEELARGGDAARFDFPRALGSSGQQNGAASFSFSGLKTSLRYRLEKMSAGEIESAKADLCASYQAAVIGQLTAKTEAALHSLEAGSGPARSLSLSGGVANNTTLRQVFAAIGKRRGQPVFFAEPRHSGDNAGMIAFAAWADEANCVKDSDERPLSFEPGLGLE